MLSLTLNLPGKVKATYVHCYMLADPLSSCRFVLEQRHREGVGTPVVGVV